MAITCEEIRNWSQNDNTFGTLLHNHWHTFNKSYIQQHHQIIHGAKHRQQTPTGHMLRYLGLLLNLLLELFAYVLKCGCLNWIQKDWLSFWTPSIDSIYSWSQLCLHFWHDKTTDSCPLSLIWPVLAVGLNSCFFCNFYECMKSISPLLALHLGPSQAQPEEGTWVSLLMGRPPMWGAKEFGSSLSWPAAIGRDAGGLNAGYRSYSC